MDATNTPKCIKCKKNDRKVKCGFCAEKLYCDDKCGADNFNSHRHTCQFTEKTLSLQTCCAVCETKVSATSPVCSACHGIKYCSTECMVENAEEHIVVCQNYIDVPPRPSQDHRLHLMLPFQRHPALSFGFVWRKNMEEVKNEIAPGPASQNFHSLSLFQEDDEGDREVAAYHVLRSNPNEVLGDLVAGRPTQQITGSFCIHVYVADDDNEGIDDALPSDLHKALHRVAPFERKFGPVKIVLDPSIDALYAGGAA